jgi:hypothetical protein
MEKESPMPPATGGSSSSTDEATIHHNEHPLHAEHGVLIDEDPKHRIASDEEYEHHHNLLWSRIRHFARDPFMEFCKFVHKPILVARVCLLCHVRRDPHLYTDAQRQQQSVIGKRESLTFPGGTMIMIIFGDGS